MYAYFNMGQLWCDRPGYLQMPLLYLVSLIFIVGPRIRVRYALVADVCPSVARPVVIYRKASGSSAVKQTTKMSVINLRRSHAVEN